MCFGVSGFSRQRTRPCLCRAPFSLFRLRTKRTSGSTRAAGALWRNGSVPVRVSAVRCLSSTIRAATGLRWRARARSALARRLPSRRGSWTPQPARRAMVCRSTIGTRPQRSSRAATRTGALARSARAPWLRIPSARPRRRRCRMARQASAALAKRRSSQQRLRCSFGRTWPTSPSFAWGPARPARARTLTARRSSSRTMRAAHPTHRRSRIIRARLPRPALRETCGSTSNSNPTRNWTSAILVCILWRTRSVTPSASATPLTTTRSTAIPSHIRRIPFIGRIPAPIQ